MYSEYEYEDVRYHECADCESRRFEQYHTQDHLKGLQLAMMRGNVGDIAFHLEEICSANHAEYIYQGETSDE